MSFEQLKQINETTARIPMNLKPAILKHVSTAQRNHHEITGRRRDPKFFYREASDEDLRRGLMRRAGEVYFAFAFASQESRLILDREFDAWSETVQAFSLDRIVEVRSMWAVREEADALLNVLTSAMVAGNRIEARSALLKMRRNIDTMLTLCDTQMPSPFTQGVFK